MNVIVMIDGREAIPVRAIPLVTNWRFMSPDTLAHVLGGTGGSNVGLFGDLHSNYLEDGKAQPVGKDWWAQFPLKELWALSEKIRSNVTGHEAGYTEWRKQSLKELPAGVFVWKDEYQELHDKNWHSQFRQTYCALRVGNTEGELDDPDKASETLAQHKLTREELVGDDLMRRDLRESLEILKRWEKPDYSPFMASELGAVVMEGFEPQQPAPASEAEHAEVEALIGRITAVRQGIDYWETRDDSKASDAEIKERKLLTLRAELVPLLAKKRMMRGDYTDTYPAPRQTVARPHTTSSDASSFDEVHGGALTEYLPTFATVAQACHWLRATNGDSWTLARLLEHGLRPWVWLDSHPGWPSIFGNRLEGYLAQMVFAGDVQRLQVDGSEALITMTHTHDGKIIKIEPGLRAPISELRFIREDVQALVKGPSLQRSSSVSGTELVADDETPAGEVAGSITTWTVTRKAEARSMRDRLRSEGKHNFRKQTAEHFGVSPQRLDAVLKDSPVSSLTKKLPQNSVFDVKSRAHKIK